MNLEFKRKISLEEKFHILSFSVSSKIFYCQLLSIKAVNWQIESHQLFYQVIYHY